MSNLNIQVFSSCNCQCAFCNFTDKCKNKIDSAFVKEYLAKHPEINYILLTGGEPTFAIKECSEILKGLDLTKKRVVLQTNGWWGNNDEIKKAIKDTPPSCVHLSVDSEKQKIIPLDIVQKAYDFLLKNNIQTFVVNHHEATNENEFEYYSSIFPDIKYGRIIKDDGETRGDCGIALLATNKIGHLDIKGWY